MDVEKITDMVNQIKGFLMGYLFDLDINSIEKFNYEELQCFQNKLGFFANANIQNMNDNVLQIFSEIMIKIAKEKEFKKTII